MDQVRGVDHGDRDENDLREEIRQAGRFDRDMAMAEILLPDALSRLRQLIAPHIRPERLGDTDGLAASEHLENRGHDARQLSRNRSTCGRTEPAPIVR
jgi:hypothetical protein